MFTYLDKHKKMLDGVCITGGEPTIQVGLRAFIERVKEMGLLVKLDTNGVHPEFMRAILADKKNVRVLETGGLPNFSDARMTLKTISGGWLLQTADNGHITEAELHVVTDRAPTAQELKDLLFAFRVCKHVKSNAIIYAKGGKTVGIGAGQMSRIDSSRIAAWKAKEAGTEIQNSVVASDAFFPFPDGLLAAADAGATAVIQPGGSIKDKDVIAAANDRGLAMVLTGMRHFRH
mgnify:CR=1 FL=1